MHEVHYQYTFYAASNCDNQELQSAADSNTTFSGQNGLSPNSEIARPKSPDGPAEVSIYYYS